MTPEILNILYVVGGLAVGWIARHRGVLAPATPVVVPVPGSPPAPVVLPSVPFKTGNPAIDGMISLFLPKILQLLQTELEAKFGEIATRILPPADIIPPLK